MRWFKPSSAVERIAFEAAIGVRPRETLRILLVADFNWLTGRERHTANVKLFDLRTKLFYAATRANHTVVPFSDRAVFRNGRRFGLTAAAQAHVRRRFLQTVDELRPDVILLHFADHISNAVLEEARRLSPGVRIADLNVDPLSDPANRARLLDRRDAVDGVFVTTAGEALQAFAGRRSFACFMPNPADPSVETGRVFEQAEFAADLVFPANDDSLRAVGEARLRPSQALAAIRAELPGVRISSPGLEQPKARGYGYFEALHAAKAGWSLSRHNDEPLYASARMTHMLASGLLTCIDRRTGLDRFYGEDEAAFYSGFDDLLGRLRAFMADDAMRREVAERGWRRTWRLFDSGRVLDYVLAQLFEEPRAHGYEWPTRRWTAPALEAARLTCAA